MDMMIAFIISAYIPPKNVLRASKYFMDFRKYWAIYRLLGRMQRFWESKLLFLKLKLFQLKYSSDTKFAPCTRAHCSINHDQLFLFVYKTAFSQIANINLLGRTSQPYRFFRTQLLKLLKKLSTNLHENFRDYGLCVKEYNKRYLASYHPHIPHKNGFL